MAAVYEINEGPTNPVAQLIRSLIRKSYLTEQSNRVLTQKWLVHGSLEAS